MIILVLGGARSGKSTFAEAKARALQAEQKTDVLYIATAIGFDAAMKDRIKKHQASRPASWHTLEQYKAFETLGDAEAFKKSDIILLDCMTLMITNLLLESEEDFDHISCEQVDVIEHLITEQVLTFVEVCKRANKSLIIVANEVGLGLVPAYKLGSIFRDIAGRINQILAKEAQQVYLLTAGIPLTLKEKE
ncbi:MAG: bifunctional adenosylcobinamide kinase/adenosylcobinamide-phosphate guanylyltransferase [Cellulosilyticaceae bacterium]